MHYMNKPGNAHACPFRVKKKLLGIRCSRDCRSSLWCRNLNLWNLVIQGKFRSFQKSCKNFNYSPFLHIHKLIFASSANCHFRRQYQKKNYLKARLKEGAQKLNEASPSPSGRFRITEVQAYRFQSICSSIVKFATQFSKPLSVALLKSVDLRDSLLTSALMKLRTSIFKNQIIDELIISYSLDV